MCIWKVGRNVIGFRKVSWFFRVGKGVSKGVSVDVVGSK